MVDYALHPEKSPDIDAIFAALAAFDVEYILAGSVAAKLYGADVRPGDLDIVPALDRENLVRIAALLSHIEGRPPGPFGAWTTLPNGERKWIARETSQEEIDAWVPNPDDITTMDHFYLSRLGNFDVVPEVKGSYEFLRPRAVMLPVNGLRIPVVHIDDLLARMAVPRREKDIPRVAQLRDIQRRMKMSED